jgi:alkylation response protein AidB-like acyl-CoA dehydrogenase
MDFSLNELQTMLADSISRFIDNEYDFDKRQSYADSERGFSDDVWAKFADLGWTAVPFAEDDGGIGGGPADVMVLMENLARGLIVEPYLANVILAGGILARTANDSQKERWLHPIIGGELHATLAYYEPQARYELADIATTAKPDGDGWRVSGRKGVVPNAATADLVIVPARTAGNAGDPDGITLFAVPAADVACTGYRTVDGLRAAEIALDDVRVGADHVLGKPNSGFAPLDATIDDATLAVCAEAVGLMRVLTDRTVEYSKQRVQFGVPIGSFQALQHRMVDMFTDCEQSYSLLLWATMRAAQGAADAKRAISSIKYQVGTAGRKVGQEAVQIHGGMGVSWDVDIAHFFKRLTAIDQIFGNADWHLDRLAG